MSPVRTILVSSDRLTAPHRAAWAVWPDGRCTVGAPVDGPLCCISVVEGDRRPLPEAQRRALDVLVSERRHAWPQALVVNLTIP